MAHIFVVDDDRTTSRLLVTLLQLEGHQVTASARPETILERARTDRPDAFIMDCHLGRNDGIALLRTLRADPLLSEVPVIMTSGLDRRDECLRAGAQEFLLKPFPPDELIGQMHKLLSAV